MWEYLNFEKTFNFQAEHDKTLGIKIAGNLDSLSSEVTWMPTPSPKKAEEGKKALWDVNDIESDVDS